MAKIILFLVLSLLLLFFTLQRPHRHRFLRFFAFESLLGLVIINADFWFRDPGSPLQLVSWFLLMGSFLLAWHGFRMLRIFGRPDGDLENTTQLATAGAYRFIRHPLYGSLLLLGLGAFLKYPSFFGGILLAILCFFVYGTGRVEERDNLKRFGQQYADYMKTTKMFIPFIL